MCSTDCPLTEIYSAGSRAVYSFCDCPSALRTRSGSPLCFHNSLNEMLNSDNKRSTPISSTQTETDRHIQRLSERSVAVLAQAQYSRSFLKTNLTSRHPPGKTCSLSFSKDWGLKTVKVRNYAGALTDSIQSCSICTHMAITLLRHRGRHRA